MKSNDKTVIEAKRVASINDIILPVPQGRALVVLLLEQAGLECETGLYRDHQSPNDPWFDKADTVEISRGSVFYTGEPPCEPRETCNAPPKHVVTVNDHPEIVIRTEQSEDSIRRLFDIDESMEIFIDTMSPDDQILEAGEDHNLTNGNVLLAKDVSIEVKVNNHPVILIKRTVTGAALKKTAISKGATLEQDAILSVKKDGINVPLDDDETICLSDGLCFMAIAPDDNSYGATSNISATVETAINDLKRQFTGHKIDLEEVANGVNVTVHGIELTERYQQDETWIGFHIHRLYPQGDIYPHFVRLDLSPNGGCTLPAAMLNQRPFANKPARMVSRRSPRWNPLLDTADKKLLKVIQYIREG